MKKITAQERDTLIFLVCVVGTSVGIGLTLGAPLGVAYAFLVIGAITFLKLIKGGDGDEIDPKL